MAATQRMLLRGMQERDMDFLFGSILLMGTGMLVDAVYTELRFGKDYSKKSLTENLLAAFDSKESAIAAIMQSGLRYISLH